MQLMTLEENNQDIVQLNDTRRTFILLVPKLGGSYHRSANLMKHCLQTGSNV